MIKEKSRDVLKENLLIRSLYAWLKTVNQFFRLHPVLFFKKQTWFIWQKWRYTSAERNPNFPDTEWYPCLFDNTTHTPLEPTYFFQDSWAAQKIFQLKPVHHYDVGSSVKTMGIISQYLPVTMVDIRPIDLHLDNLSFKKGSILDLPFEDSSIQSLSSLCVVEHIGLGRYGDPIDPFGSEKAISELKRVLKPGGVLLFSVPVDCKNKVYFNAHRAFTRDFILSLFEGYELLEERYHYGCEMVKQYTPERGFGTGFYMVKKL
jgi:hypothetical protein